MTIFSQRPKRASNGAITIGSSLISKRSFDFAFSVPCQVPNYGSAFVLSNRLFPGETENARTVSNWLTISNLSGDSHLYNVKAYSEEGQLLDTDLIAIGAQTRFDVDMSRFADVSLISVIPDDETKPYMALLNRYDNGEGNQRVLAFSSYAQDGDSDTRCVPVSNNSSTESYTEIGNGSASAINVTETLYNADGTVVETKGVKIPAHGVRHIDFASRLASGTSGSLCLSANVPQAIIYNQTSYYYSPDRQVVTGFLTTPNKVSGATTIFGAKNYFFNAFNWLRLMNLSDSTVSIDVSTDPNESTQVDSNYTLAPHQRLDIALHDSPFRRMLNTYGRFLINGRVAADLVRVIPNGASANAGNSAMFVTSVR